MYTPQTLKINILDFSEANKMVTQSLAKNDTEKFYFAVQHYGLIDCNNRYFLVSKECVIKHPQVNDIKRPALLFELTIMQELKDALQLHSPLKSDLNADFVDRMKTGQTSTLQEFMAEHYNSSTRVCENMHKLLEYLNQETKIIKYPLI